MFTFYLRVGQGEILLFFISFLRKGNIKIAETCCFLTLHVISSRRAFTLRFFFRSRRQEICSRRNFHGFFSHRQRRRVWVKFSPGLMNIDLFSSLRGLNMENLEICTASCDDRRGKVDKWKNNVMERRKVIQGALDFFVFNNLYPWKFHRHIFVRPFLTQPAFRLFSRGKSERQEEEGKTTDKENPIREFFFRAQFFYEGEEKMFSFRVMAKKGKFCTTARVFH